MRWSRSSRPSREQRLDSELQFHLEQRIADNISAGMTPEEARRSALSEFEGLERVKEECRELHWQTFAESVGRDFRYGIRNLVKDRRFSLLAVLALALGIGAATVIFSAVYGVLLNTFPFKDADQVTSFSIVDVSRPQAPRESLKLSEFLYFRDHNHVFQDLSGEYGGFGSTPVRYTTGGSTYQIDADYITVNSFDFFGVQPLLGRLPNQDDVKPGAAPVFVIGAKLWKQQFESDPSVVGRSFTLNGVPTVLVGVMPPRFRWAWVDAWIPITVDENEIEANPQMRGRFLYTVGRLKPGVTMDQAAADLNIVAHQYAQIEPKLYPKRFTVTARTLAERVIGGFRDLVYPLAGAVALLLLIACVNVANLLLARATVRGREIAVRAALGASRARLMRQFLVESICLAAAGCVAGWLFAYAGIKALVPFVPYNAFPQEAVIDLNGHVLLFSLTTAAIVTLACGFVPTIHALRGDLRAGLSGAPGSTPGTPHGKFRSALVILEVALSVVLLVGAGLLMHVFFGMRTTDLGFNPNQVLFARLSFPEHSNTTAQQQSARFEEFVDRLKSLPGVTAVTPVFSMPPGAAANSEIAIPGKVHSERWVSLLDFCGEQYASVLQVRVLRGRFLSEEEVKGARRMVVINEAFARQYFGDENPVGQSVKFTALDQFPDLKDALFEVVGVTANVKNQLFKKPPDPEAYLAFSILPQSGATAFAIRTAIAPESILPSVRKLVWSVDPNVALVDVTSLDSWLNKYVYANSAFQFMALGTFASIGLLLVMIGVFSVMAYTVALQTREIGIRMALGAARETITKMVLGRGAVLIGAGLVLGLLGSVATKRFMGHYLVGVSALDPWTYVGALALMIATGALACVSPALRAARVDPLKAIRYE